MVTICCFLSFRLCPSVCDPGNNVMIFSTIYLQFSTDINIQQFNHNISNCFDRQIFLYLNLHSCLMAAIFIGMNGDLAALRGFNISLHNRREILVKEVVTRQNAARVFITGRGLPDLTINPWAVARCLARCAFKRNSYRK